MACDVSRELLSSLRRQLDITNAEVQLRCKADVDAAPPTRLEFKHRLLLAM